MAWIDKRAYKMTVKELATIFKDKCIEGKGEHQVFITTDGKVSFPIVDIKEVEIEHLKFPLIVIKGVK